ncbi:MAG TPA: hypothetical protein VFB06_32900 [Streptosporangiaceae bacterium]|nr:hypothetical protein [Streptosporangiaceae bacterium]
MIFGLWRHVRHRWPLSHIMLWVAVAAWAAVALDFLFKLSPRNDMG